MARKTKYNPERRTWRGRSHKKGGRRVAQIRTEAKIELKSEPKSEES